MGKGRCVPLLGAILQCSPTSARLQLEGHSRYPPETTKRRFAGRSASEPGIPGGLSSSLASCPDLQAGTWQTRAAGTHVAAHPAGGDRGPRARANSREAGKGLAELSQTPPQRARGNENQPRPKQKKANEAPPTPRHPLPRGAAQGQWRDSRKRGHRPREAACGSAEEVTAWPVPSGERGLLPPDPDPPAGTSQLSPFRRPPLPLSRPQPPKSFLEALPGSTGS